MIGSFTITSESQWADFTIGCFHFVGRIFREFVVILFARSFNNYNWRDSTAGTNAKSANEIRFSRSIMYYE